MKMVSGNPTKTIIYNTGCLKNIIKNVLGDWENLSEFLYQFDQFPFKLCEVLTSWVEIIKKSLSKI